MSDRLALYGEDIVGVLADRVTEALRNAILGVAADPRPLAVGLIGVIGQMPTVLSFNECSRYRQHLHDLTLVKIGLILGLRQIIEASLEDRRRRAASG